VTQQRSGKQVHLAAHFPGVNNTTVWSDPESGSQIEFDSFVRFAQDAEAARFDFLFLAEGLRLREQHGRIYDLDVVGRPDTFTVLAALAAVTERIGLTGTINSTFNEPYEVARQFASLDHLSDGRAAWNVVTSWDAFTGENFRRGGFLGQDQRYERARLFLDAVTTLVDSWPEHAVVADQAAGHFLAEPDPGRFAIANSQFDIEGHFDVPRSPQGRPVIFQAGDSDAGRDFAAASADAIFTRHGTLEAGQAFTADIRNRLSRIGRPRDAVKVLPATTFAIADTDEQAQELAAEIRLQQVSPATAIMLAEQVWNRDLSAYDPEGPLPDVDPVVGESTVAQGRASVRMVTDRIGTVQQWRAAAAAGGWNLRRTVAEMGNRQNLIGSPTTVADRIQQYVDSDACDGFILVPHLVPGGLRSFTDTVVPLLQERGVHRTEYEGTTLREHLGLAPLGRPAGRRAS
jgi:FMN-dependent oxidoreductase (nitrilotriacetate monooxygenase family)